MARYGFPILVLLICLPVALLAFGVTVPGLTVAIRPADPLPVPDGECELAWLHTTTNWATWERFVTGLERAGAAVPGLRVDVSRAYPGYTTEAPEVVLSAAGRAGRLRVRWYKLSGEVTATHWVQALAARDPAPLAVIGGGSSDRAADLARALAAQTKWRGDRPLLLITTATADELQGDPDRPDAEGPGPLREGRSLLDLYPERSFRFCFSNKQMAEAVLDFVWDQPDLRPQTAATVAPLAVASGLAATAPPPADAPRPQVFTVEWQDDPFSTDLHWQFRQALSDKLRPTGPAGGVGMPVQFSSWGLPFSVGGFSRPNTYEARVAEDILREYKALPPQRSLLVLPANTHQARRLLRTLSDSAPQLGNRLVAVTGDGVSVNAVYRDGEFAWPVHAVPVPLVLFAHHNPVAWDDPAAGPAPPTALLPPTSTDEVLHFSELARIVAAASFALPPFDPPSAADARLPAGADEMAGRLRRLCPGFFDDHGNRVGGTGEYVVVVRPRFQDGTAAPTPEPEARMEVWRRREDRGWGHVRTVDVDQWRTRTAPDRGRERPR